MARERYWTSFLIMGLLALAFGIVLVALPNLAWGTLLILFIAWAILYGAIAIAVSLLGRGEGWGWHLFVGLCALAIGLIGILHPHVLGIGLLTLIGIFLILGGARDVVVGIAWAKGAGTKFLFIAVGLAAICFGIALIVEPKETAETLSNLIGIFAMIWGVLTVILSLFVRSVQKGDGGEPLTPAAA